MLLESLIVPQFQIIMNNTKICILLKRCCPFIFNKLSKSKNLDWSRITFLKVKSNLYFG